MEKDDKEIIYCRSLTNRFNGMVKHYNNVKDDAKMACRVREARLNRIEKYKEYIKLVETNMIQKPRAPISILKMELEHEESALVFHDRAKRALNSLCYEVTRDLEVIKDEIKSLAIYVELVKYKRM